MDTTRICQAAPIQLLNWHNQALHISRMWSSSRRKSSMHMSSVSFWMIFSVNSARRTSNIRSTTGSMPRILNWEPENGRTRQSIVSHKLWTKCQLQTTTSWSISTANGSRVRWSGWSLCLAQIIRPKISLLWSNRSSRIWISSSSESLMIKMDSVSTAKATSRSQDGTCISDQNRMLRFKISTEAQEATSTAWILWPETWINWQDKHMRATWR